MRSSCLSGLVIDVCLLCARVCSLGGGVARSSAVKPNFSSKSFSGAEAPNVCMPMIVPRDRRRSGPSRASRPARPRRARVTAGGSTAVAIRLGPAARTAPSDGMLTTRAAMPSRRQRLVGLDAERDLAAGADQDHVGLAVRRRRPARRRRAPRRSAGGVPACGRTSAAPGGSGRGRPARACGCMTHAPGLGHLVGVGRAQRDQARDRRAATPAARSAGASGRPRRRRSNRA